MEAVITSRWKQTKYYWMIHLLFYSTLLILIAFSYFFNEDSGIGMKVVDTLKIILNYIYIVILCYIEISLLVIEFMQMKKYKTKYFTIFNIFDLCSIMLSIIVFTLMSIKSLDETDRIDGEGIVVLITITTLILWIEMVC